MTHVAFIGLGAMGSRMARHLLDAPDIVESLTVSNRTSDRAAGLLEAGARWADTPRQAAESADVVISIVSDDDAAESVWLDPERGAVRGLREGALAIESSTITPTWTRRLAAAVAERSARLLDAPVAGSTPQAEARQLAFLVGGAEADVAEATPLFELMGARVVHAGPQTHGNVLKLIVNALLGAEIAVMAELLRMGEAQGLEPARLVELLATMPVTSPAGGVMAGLMARSDHAPRFPVDLVAKDLRYAGQLADLPVVDAARKRFEAASAAGYGADNLTAVHRLGGDT